MTYSCTYDYNWYCHWQIWWKDIIWIATTSDFGNGNSNSKPRPLKFISFSLLIGQVILGDLHLHLGLQLMSSLMNLMKKHNLRPKSSWCGGMIDNIVKVANKNQVGSALISLIPLLL